MCLYISLLCVLTGRGGSTEQTEHEDQTDAKADPTQRGGDNQAESHTRMHNHEHVSRYIIHVLTYIIHT